MPVSKPTPAAAAPGPSTSQKLRAWLGANWLVLGEVLVIGVAKLRPHWGATGGPLRPEWTVSKLGVSAIFFINGAALSLSTSSPDEVRTASQTNALVQSFSFVAVPLLAKLLAPLYPDAAFRDGLLVLACLPCTINICVAQTLAAGANVACAIFNAIFANVVGVFVTPLLAACLLGAGDAVSLLGTLRKLGAVVILPLVAGQLARRSPLGAALARVAGHTRTLSSLLLLAIVHNVFSDTFRSGLGVSGAALAKLALAMPTLYLLLTLLFERLSRWLLPGLDEATRGAALLCSAQKTLAFGVPFIKTALGQREDLAYVVAPLLLYAPAQLLLGSSLLVPLLRRRIERAAELEEGAGI